MTQSPIKTFNQEHKPKFVSCIRINGVPILPPLITLEKRKELRRLKREAVKIERRLERERDLKQYITQLYNTSTFNLNNELTQCVQTSDVLCDSPCNITAFTPNDQINLEANAETTSVSSQFMLQNDRKLGLNPQSTHSCNELLKVSPYEEDKTYVLLNEESVRVVNMKEELPVDHTEKSEKTLLIPSTTPKLIRRNSYTLDAPSPALVEYYKTSANIPQIMSCWNSQNTSQLTQESKTDNVIDDSPCKDDCALQSESCIERQTINSFKKREEIPNINYFPLENDLEITSVEPTPRPESIEIPFAVNENDEIQSEVNYSENCFDTSRTETELKNFSDSESHLMPTTEGLEAFIVNNDAYHETPDKTVGETDTEWNAILKRIPSAYSRQILQVLQCHSLNNLNFDFNDTFNGNNLNPDQYSTPADITQVGDHDFSTCNTTFKCSEVEENVVEDISSNLQTTFNVAHPLGRNKAATILTAAAKGFLIRRLMKTEKVQLLIRTINETVLCAMQLHRDTLEHIEEADVELHRRLIQQVSAACYSFHDVFFSTSIQDQMSIIAVDRQKILDKRKRLSSASSTASNRSSKSSTLRKSSVSSGSARNRKLSLVA